MKGKTITAYVVQRVGWEYGDDFYYRREQHDAPVLTFLDRAKAEAHARDLQYRYVCEQKINPFGYVDMALEERSSLPFPKLLERLRQAGIEVQGEGDVARYGFYEQYEQLSEEDRRLVWDAVDNVRFFRVVPMVVDLDE